MEIVKRNSIGYVDAHPASDGICRGVNPATMKGDNMFHQPSDPDNGVCRAVAVDPGRVQATSGCGGRYRAQLDWWVSD